jgi:hypothetical protein
MTARASLWSVRAEPPNPLPTILLLTAASILLAPLAAMNIIGWVLAPGVDVREPDTVARAVQVVFVLAWFVPFLGTVAADLVSFALYRRRRDPVLLGVGALVLVLAGWAVSLTVPAILMA